MISPTLLAILFGFIAAYFLGRDLIKRATTVNSELAARRRAAAHLAGVLKTYGLDRLPAILADYGVGDYVAMYDKIHNFATVVGSSEEAVLKEFSQIFQNVLTAKLTSEDGRAFIAAKLAASAPAVDPIAAAAAALKAPVSVS